MQHFLKYFSEHQTIVWLKFWNLWEYNFEFLRNIPDRLFSVASWFSELIRLLKVVIFGETSGFLYYIIIMKSLVVT